MKNQRKPSSESESKVRLRPEELAIADYSVIPKRWSP